jgi:hypothetical protein
MAVMNTGMGGPEGFGTNVFSTAATRTGNLDDGSIQVNITSVFGPTGINYFGTNYTSIYINTNGLITFASANPAYSPTPINSYGSPAIAPFWSDVDISKGGEIYWDLNPTTGAVTITWSEVAAYTGSGPTPPVNSFQMVLTNTGSGDFSIEFIYEGIQWTNGYAGDATVGFTNGGAIDVVLPGSGNAAALTNYDTTNFGNGDANGTWESDVVDGVVLTSDGIVEGTAGDDLIDASYDDDPENDFVDGADGTGVGRNDDNIQAGAGNDTVAAGLGNDTVFGNDGADVISGGAGNDTLYGDNNAAPTPPLPFNVQYYELSGTISNLAQAGFNAVGTNSNTPTAEFSRSTLDVNAISLANGGNGETYAVRFTTTLNVTTGGTYTFTTTSDDGSRLFVDGVRIVDNDGLHSSRLRTGSTVLGPGEHDIVIVFFENTGGDNLSATISGPDTSNTPINITTADISGVSLGGGLTNNDTLDGGDGDDALFGEEGDDVLTVGVGDTAQGGDGADTFTLDFGQTSGSASTTITIDGGTGGDDNDSLDLTGRGAFTLTQTTDADGDSTSGVATYASGQVVNFSEIENLTVCFANGTQIRAENGTAPVEALSVGDRVVTRDNGLQTIRWIGARFLGPEELARFPKLQPIRIAKGALGEGTPSRDLIVSPQHRIVVRSKIAMRMFGEEEVFVPAKHLLELPDVTIAKDMTAVTYYHILCDNHEIVEADGALAETLYTGTEALKAMTPEALEEITLIFGDLPLTDRPLALFCPKGKQAKKLVERHIKNDRALYCAG